MKRLLQLFGTGLALVAGLGLLAAATPALNPGRPDILLLMPDQMRGDCLSLLEHPVVRTPTLDRLAREGALFRRAYTTVASCIPARHALLTGRFPQTSGVVGFAAQPITTTTLPQALAAAGYRTVLIGRNMHQQPAAEPYGYETQLLGSTYVGGDDYDTFLRAAAPQTGGIRQLVADLGLSFNGWEAGPWPLAEDLHPTAWIVRESQRAVAETSPDRPLFLTTSFYAPHPPLFPPRALFDDLRRRGLPEPAYGDWEDWAAIPPGGDKQGHRVRLEGETLRATQAGYFGLIEQIDAAVGPLIDAFRARSERAGRPWLIIVTSDHGEMLGDHGYFRKCEPYEGSANIPFIVAGSRELGFQAGMRCERPVCLEDIMPTLLSLARARPPTSLDGVDLGPVLRGDTVKVRDWLHFEHADCYSRAQAFQALTDGRHKYIWRPLDGTEQLFDLTTDPVENRNLADDPDQAALLLTWRSRLIERLRNRPEGFSDGSRLIPGRPYPPLHSRLPSR
ncbi:MAG: sulfatase-like hydrolase/transferase [Verrucomicrobiales bacterium]|nr:sulfatase-like hydrolase/transferase [Verrucomicrobiales bacterium]